MFFTDCFCDVVFLNFNNGFVFTIIEKLIRRNMPFGSGTRFNGPFIFLSNSAQFITGSIALVCLILKYFVTTIAINNTALPDTLVRSQATTRFGIFFVVCSVRFLFSLSYLNKTKRNLLTYAISENR